MPRTLLAGLALLVATACSGTGPAPWNEAIPDPQRVVNADPGPRPIVELFERLVEGNLWMLARGSGSGTAPSLITGPAHCSASETLWLIVPRDAPAPGPAEPPGYLRDPKGLLTSYSTVPLLPRAPLPADAVATGWTFGNAELWLAPSDEKRFAYLVARGDRTDVERWPALAGLCA